MKASFESLLARAAAIGASVRLEPKRDARTGNLVVVAHLHGERLVSKYLVTGAVVTPVDLEAADRPNPA